MNKKLLLLSLVPALTVGCNLVRKHGTSFDPIYEQEIPLNAKMLHEKKVHDQKSAKKELGLNQSELSDLHQQILDNRIELKKLEEELDTETAKQQYYEYKAYMNSDRQRIQFLELPTVEQREAMAIQLGLPQKAKQKSAYEEDAIIENDIFIGMTRKAVRESWGEPEVVEVAGNPLYGNERWKYSTYVATAEGFLEEERVIYFEGGRIVGWNKN